MRLSEIPGYTRPEQYLCRVRNVCNTRLRRVRRVRDFKYPGMPGKRLEGTSKYPGMLGMPGYPTLMYPSPVTTLPFRLLEIDMSEHDETDPLRRLSRCDRAYLNT